MPDPPKARQRFRNSCTNCATAKVKCSTTRPECARCVERGLSCIYALSNRYGRLPSSAATSRDGPLPTPQEPADADFNVYDQAFGQLDMNNYWIPSSDDTTGSFSAGVVPFQDPAQLNNLQAPFFEDWDLEKLRGTSQLGLAGGGSSLASASHFSNSEATSELSHSCLAQAANILIEIRNDSSSTDLMWAAAASSTRSPEARSRDVKSIMGDVIFANRRVADQVCNILECACMATDYQISVIVSLVWFHMIDRYAKAVQAAAATARSGPGHNHVIGSVQVLLGELQRLSPSIDKLSMGVGESPDRGMGGVVGVSVSGFNQLKSDLTQHLVNVYSEAERFLQEIPE